MLEQMAYLFGSSNRKHFCQKKMAGGAESELQDLQSAEISRVTLKFRDPGLEASYQYECVAMNTPLTRVYLFIGLATYLMFGALDFILLGDQAATIYMFRIAAALGIAICIAVTFIKGAENRIQSILFVALGIAACGMIGMSAILKPPYSYMYYAGIILVIIYGTNLSIRYYLSGINSLCMVAAYAFVACVINPIPYWVLIANLFFLFSTMTWTIWSSYWQETYKRREFAQKVLLEAEKLRTEELLEAARAGNRAKSEFLAVMSHELRTPLNAIIGFSEIMQRQLYGPIGSEKYAGYVEDISDSGNHLLRVINDILDLSKAEAGKLEIYEDEVDICELVRNTARMFREKSAEAGITMVVDEPAKEPMLWADSRLVRQLLINLVSNAVKFTPKGGSVTLSVSITEELECRLAVSDTGIGLKESDIPRVLEPFVQVESALSRKNGGTGLGLPLVKRIVERHDGVFELKSTLGKGTTAIATFPAARVMGQQVQQVQAHKQPA